MNFTDSSGLIYDEDRSGWQGNPSFRHGAGGLGGLAGGGMFAVYNSGVYHNDIFYGWGQLSSLFGGAGGAPQDTSQPQRPKKERALIVVREKRGLTYDECVRREWRIFDQAVANVKQAAAKESDMWRIRWSIWQTFTEIFNQRQGTVPSSTDRISEGVVDGYGDYAMRAGEAQAIETGTKREADKRDEAIKNNCKKPT